MMKSYFNLILSEKNRCRFRLQNLGLATEVQLMIVTIFYLFPIPNSLLYNIKSGYIVYVYDYTLIFNLPKRTTLPTLPTPQTI